MNKKNKTLIVLILLLLFWVIRTFGKNLLDIVQPKQYIKNPINEEFKNEIPITPEKILRPVVVPITTQFAGINEELFERENDKILNHTYEIRFDNSLPNWMPGTDFKT